MFSWICLAIFQDTTPPPRVSQWQDRSGANVVTPVMWAQRAEESKGGLGLGGAVWCGLRPTSGSEIWVREIWDPVRSETEDTEDTCEHSDIPQGWSLIAPWLVTSDQILTDRDLLSLQTTRSVRMKTKYWPLLSPWCFDSWHLETLSEASPDRSLIDSSLTPELR